MTTNEVIESIDKMTKSELELVAESVNAREEELLEAEVVRRRDDLLSGRVKGLTYEEVFGPLKKKYGSFGSESV